MEEITMGEKKWNKRTSNWEIDGVPVTYTVSWENIDDGGYYTKEFSDVDQGYDFYQQRLKDANCINVTWQHNPW